MSKHTPGPWKALAMDSAGWVDIVQQDTDEAWPLPFVACKHFDQEANARLIAAAPDLLEALKKIAAFRPLTFAECSDAEAVMGLAEDAIAKATGGSE